MIKVSQEAKSEVIKLMEADGFNHDSDYIRVGVKSGGCSGLTYDLNFDKCYYSLTKLPSMYMTKCIKTNPRKR